MVKYTLTENEAKQLADYYARVKAGTIYPEQKFDVWFTKKYIGFYNEAMEIMEQYNQSVEA